MNLVHTARIAVAWQIFGVVDHLCGPVQHLRMQENRVFERTFSMLRTHLPFPSTLLGGLRDMLIRVSYVIDDPCPICQCSPVCQCEKPVEWRYMKAALSPNVVM